MIEYWHVLMVIAGALCNIVLLFMFVNWFRKARFFEVRETVRKLSIFYEVLAVVCFFPFLSPSYWISNSSLFWDFLGLFLLSVYHGAGIGMWFISFICFSTILCLLCIITAFELSNQRGIKLGFLISFLFILTSLFSLISLYHSLILNFGDPKYYWTAYLLYMLANVSIIISNVFSSYYLIKIKHILASC